MPAPEIDAALIGVQRRVLTAPIESVLRDLLATATRACDADGARLDEPDGTVNVAYGEVEPAVQTLSVPVLTLHQDAGLLVAVRTRPEPFPDAARGTLALLAEVAASALLAVEAATRDALAAVRAETLATMHGSSGQLRALFSSSPLGVALVRSSDFALLRTNDALAELTGVPSRELALTTLLDLVPRTEHDDLSSWLRGLPDNVKGSSREVRLDRTRGEPVWTRLFAAMVHGAVPEQLVVQVEDITSQRAAQQLLSRLAHTDPLTGLANRLQVERQLGSALSRPGSEEVGLLYVDLDGFKEINDRLGHIAGDQLLARIADRLASSVRPRDVVGRMGGDEFVVVVDHVVDLAELEHMTERIREALSADVELPSGDSVRVSASIGLSTAHPGESPAVLLSRADEEMYAEKRRRAGLRPQISGPRSATP